ncbi:hypothetical protein BLA29_010677, partial [Euroglyphus maynei]
MKSLAIEVLLNPTLLTLTQCLRNVLQSPTGQIEIIYAGATFTETGSWLLADGTFSAYNFYELIEEEVDHKRLNPNGFNRIPDNNNNGNDPCNGHKSIAEHLSSHDIIVYLHTEPAAGEWAILQDIFSQQHIDTHSMTKSMITSSLILNDDRTTTNRLKNMKRIGSA